MSEIPCSKKGCPNSEDEFHHIIPKFMGGKDIDGRIYLCKKHHDGLHHYILGIVWSFVGNKEKCKETIKNSTLRWLEK